MPSPPPNRVSCRSTSGLSIFWRRPFPHSSAAAPWRAPFKRARGGTSLTIDGLKGMQEEVLVRRLATMGPYASVHSCQVGSLAHKNFSLQSQKTDFAFTSRCTREVAHDRLSTTQIVKKTPRCSSRTTVCVTGSPWCCAPGAGSCASCGLPHTKCFCTILYVVSHNFEHAKLFVQIYTQNRTNSCEISHKFVRKARMCKIM